MGISWQSEPNTIGSVLSINNVRIRLTQERWLHITNYHKELIDFQLEILLTISNPDNVYSSPEGSRRRSCAARWPPPSPTGSAPTWRRWPRGLGSEISDLDNFDSFECRGRNRVVGRPVVRARPRQRARRSRALKLANGQIDFAHRPRPFRATLRESRAAFGVRAVHRRCWGRARTGYHEDHIHLDLMERRNNYRICQWNVWDPLPQIAPLLPAARPEEAPPREVAKPKPNAAKTGNKVQGRCGQLGCHQTPFRA
jgi:hypothetical protein